MKKTLIAAGIAAVVAAPAAFADVAVSGQVKMTFKSVEAYNNGATVTGYDFDNALTFKASEDLGNGMSAFATISLDLDNMADSANTTLDKSSKDQVVGIKGSFGTVMGGRMETLTEGKVSSRLDDGSKAHAANEQTESDLTTVGRANAIAYITPTFNGFHAAVAVVDAGTDADDQTIEATGTDVAIFYDNGPLSIAASSLDRKNSTTTDVDQIVASYKMGEAKVTVGYVEKDTSEDMIFRLDYNLGGGNSLLVGYRDMDRADNTTEYDPLSVKLTHAFSKRTAVWAGYRSKDNAGDVMHAGMIHKF
jgi:predicted porin